MPRSNLVFNIFNFLISSHISTLFLFVNFSDSYLTVCGQKRTPVFVFKSIDGRFERNIIDVIHLSCEVISLTWDKAKQGLDKRADGRNRARDWGKGQHPQVPTPFSCFSRCLRLYLTLFFFIPIQQTEMKGNIGIAIHKLDQV